MTTFRPMTWEEVQELRQEIYHVEISMENLSVNHPQYIRGAKRLSEIEGEIERNLIHFKNLKEN